jgi:tetratricopeptide (TPR) repeat protein
VRIELALREGGESGRSLETGEASLGRALTLDAQDRAALEYLGELRSAAARWKASHGHAKPRDFDLAAEPFTKVLGLVPDSQESLLALTHLYLARAAWERKNGLDPGPTLVQGRAWLARILKARPRLGVALALQGGLNLEEAEGLSPKGRSVKAQEALQTFREALGLNRNLLGDWQPRVDRATTLARAAP